METILSHPFVVQLVLPFLLVFTVIFAILDKTEILGEGKRQINAIVSFVTGLIFISFSYTVGLTIQLMAFTGIIAVILLIFLMFYAFISSGEKGFEMPSGLKITLGILVALALIIALLIFTGGWDFIFRGLETNLGKSIAINGIFIIVIIVGFVVVFLGGKKDEK